MIILGTIIFAGVCFKRRDLISWLFAFIAGSGAELFRLISQEDYDLYALIGLGFSSLTLFLIILAVIKDYYNNFLRPVRSVSLSLFSLTLVQIILSVSLRAIIGVLLVIAFFLILRIYLKIRTPTYAFFGFILISGIINLIATTLSEIGLEGAEEFFNFSSAVMATNIFLTGIVALIEDRLVRSEKEFRLAFNRAELYKDLFVHDINNILQNLEFSLEILSQQCGKHSIEGDTKELLILAKKQVNRGAELGINVRKLSDLELGKVNPISVNVNDNLVKAIEFVKPRFPGKEITIKIDSQEDSYMVNANEYLYDTFRIIINNSIRYNDNSKIEIEIKITQMQEEGIKYVRIEFVDNGTGMPDAMKENIFYRIYDESKSFKRFGLGLLLVREVIQSLNGKVWAEDKIKGDFKKGTKIIILIPESQ
jgi:signal transduction histidine kinase